METQKLIFVRNFLFRTFLIGLAFAIFYLIATIAFWNSSMMSWLESAFKVSEAEIRVLTLSFFSLIRFMLAFMILVPCIVLHWMIKQKNRTELAARK